MNIFHISQYNMAEYTNRDTYNCDYFSIFVSIFQVSKGLKRCFLHIAYIAFANFDKWATLCKLNEYNTLFGIKFHIIYIVFTSFQSPKYSTIFDIRKFKSSSENSSDKRKDNVKNCTKINFFTSKIIIFNCKFFVNCSETVVFIS